MIKRLGHCVFSLLVALDVVACVLWLSTLYPFGLADRPTGHETISAYIGRAQQNGMWWARKVAPVIDRVAVWLGDRPNHCYRSFQFWSQLKGGR